MIKTKEQLIADSMQNAWRQLKSDSEFVKDLYDKLKELMPKYIDSEQFDVDYEKSLIAHDSLCEGSRAKSGLLEIKIVKTDSDAVKICIFDHSKLNRFGRADTVWIAE